MVGRTAAAIDEQGKGLFRGVIEPPDVQGRRHPSRKVKLELTPPIEYVSSRRWRVDRARLLALVRARHLGRWVEMSTGSYCGSRRASG